MTEKTPPSAGQPAIVRIGHADPENQQPFPPFLRLYEYADFFPRTLTVHRGDTVNYQTQPFSFHIVALSADEEAARRAYPIMELNTDDAPAIATGMPTVSFGDGAFPVTGGSVNGGGFVDREKGKGPPVVGAVQFGQAPGVFTGGDAVEVIGPTVGWDLDQRPAMIDQLIVIDAPPGEYAFFDMLHPNMRGTLVVVDDDQPVTTQAEADERSERQFQESRAQARVLETFLNGLTSTHAVPGGRDLVVCVGAAANEGRVLVNAMMPAQVEARAGDRIHFLWSNSSGTHTVGFAQKPGDIDSPFGFEDVDGGYIGVENTFNAPPPAPPVPPGRTGPKFLGDPGNAPSGTALGRIDEVVNSGLLVGSEFGLDTASCWSVAVTEDTEKGPHTFFDGVHPWMCGVVVVE